MKKFYRAGWMGLAVCLCLASAYGYRRHSLQQDLAERILRFHVIANSDSSKDQALKLKVRDKIGGYLKEKLDQADGLEESEQVVEANLAQIEDCARETIRQEGYDYAVKAQIAETDFPEKTYGEYTFPSGRYHALRVVIGDGIGQNWWCVMYPNLCFSNSVYEVVEEGADERLQAVLGDENYTEMMAEGNIQARFKYLPFLNNLW